MSSSPNPTKWGILGVGKICNDFVTALRLLPTEHSVVAVAARSGQSAEVFAKKHSIKSFYEGYDNLINDQEVEVVYIGLINPAHYPWAKTAIDKKKHVLCEKPLCINVKETKLLIDHAKKHRVFLMEANWFRFFPATKRLQEELNKASIGEVLHVYASLGCALSFVPNCTQVELGGGSLLNFGIYCVQLATMVFGKDEKPEKIMCAGHLNEGKTDETLSLTLLYSRGRMATLLCSTKVNLMNDAVITGTKGSIRIPEIFCCPTKLYLGDGETLNFPLPRKHSGMEFSYPNSEGLSYEGSEVRRCILEGLQESPRFTHSESILVAEIMEEARKQVGVSYLQD